MAINWWRGFLYPTVGSLAVFKPAVSAYPKSFRGMKINPSLNGWEHLEAKGEGAWFYEVNSKEKPLEKNSAIKLWRNLSWMKGCQLQSGCRLMLLYYRRRKRQGHASQVGAETISGGWSCYPNIYSWGSGQLVQGVPDDGGGGTSFWVKVWLMYGWLYVLFEC